MTHILSRALQRYLPFIGSHHVLMLILAIEVTLFSFLLAACTSTSSIATSLYVASFSYKQADSSHSNTAIYNTTVLSTTHLEVRVSYFGLCANSGKFWLCDGTYATLFMAQELQNDPLELIGIADRYRHDVLFPGLLFGAMVLAVLTFILLATFPGWHAEEDEITGSEIDVKPFPSRSITQLALLFAGVGAVFAGISALWQHLSAAAAVMLEEATATFVKVSIGPGATALIWLGALCSVIVTNGLLFILVTMDRLNQLVEP